MTSGVFLSVVLPAYNEAQRISSTLAAMRTFLDRQEYTYEIIVAADGDQLTRGAGHEILCPIWSVVRSVLGSVVHRGRHDS